MPPAKSLFFSLVAAMRNWQAFVVYGITVMAIGVVVPGLILFLAAAASPDLFTIMAAAMRMVLFLVLVPVLMASVYLSYRDIFVIPVSDNA